MTVDRSLVRHWAIEHGVNGVLCTTECPNGTKAWMCNHLDGTVSLVMNKPEKGVLPKVVFTNNPRVDRR